MKTSNMEVSLIGHFGSDLSVVNAARVSFHKQSEWADAPGDMWESDVKLIKYLAKHKHFSPFNHAFLSFRVKAPIFVARQLVKHKFLPWNEVSRRYVDEEPEFYFPDGWRLRAENVKQGSSEKTIPVQWQDKELIKCALEHYQILLEEGVAPEEARMVLPQNTMTEWVWSGTLGAWLDMLVLRLDTHTQQETRDLANHIAIFIEDLFPVSFAARVENV